LVVELREEGEFAGVEVEEELRVVDFLGEGEGGDFGEGGDGEGGDD
jgi:hypothetical protein